MTTANDKHYRRFKDDIDWSVRYLSIHNISKSRAHDIVNEIVNDLAVVSWTNLTENIRVRLFNARLKYVVLHLKAA